MLLIKGLIDVRTRLSRALDRAAMSVAYGEEAACHYNENYTLACGLQDWMTGFRESWQLSDKRMKVDFENGVSSQIVESKRLN